MNKLFLGLCAGVIILVAIFGCSTEDSTVGPEVVSDFEAYIRFDTSHFIFTLVNVEFYENEIYEKAVNWERCLGEPFIDMNGNGIYEAGIDSFIIALDPAVNQDLNRNNQYDGPESGYEGLPFDDIDGDGEFRVNPNDGGRYYEPGLPFADFNGNGVRDSGMSISGEMASFSAFTGLQGHTWYTAVWPPWSTYIGYRFISDSGKAYLQDIYWAGGFNNLVVNDTGLVFYADPEFVNYDLAFPLLVAGVGDFSEVTDEPFRVPVSNHDTITVLRTVRLNETLDIGGHSFDDLMVVDFEGDAFRYRFRFARDHGILSYSYENIDPQSQEIQHYYNFYYLEFVDKADSVFLPMTR